MATFQRVLIRVYVSLIMGIGKSALYSIRSDEMGERVRRTDRRVRSIQASTRPTTSSDCYSSSCNAKHTYYRDAPKACPWVALMPHFLGLICFFPECQASKHAYKDAETTCLRLRESRVCLPLATAARFTQRRTRIFGHLSNYELWVVHLELDCNCRVFEWNKGQVTWIGNLAGLGWLLLLGSKALKWLKNPVCINLTASYLRYSDGKTFRSDAWSLTSLFHLGCDLSFSFGTTEAILASVWSILITLSWRFLSRRYWG